MHNRTQPSDGTIRRAASYGWRALGRRCPNCGSRGLWERWLRMRDTCPGCGINLERGEHGYIVGAYMFNIVGAELVFAALFVGIVLWTWPDPPWGWLQWGGVALMVLLPVLLYPFSKTLFLAFDLLFRPQGSEADDRVRGAGNRR